LEQSKQTEQEEEEEEQWVKDSRGGCRAQGGTGDRKGDANNKKGLRHRRPVSARSSGSRRDPKQPLACPWFTPATKCKLRLLKLDRVKDYLLMEEEFVAGQERLKP